MSILIKGMEMPKSCWHCEFCRDGLDEYAQHYDYCVALDMNILISQTERHENCPLVEVPKHGRLIDADVLTEQMERNLWAIEDKAEKELGFDETLRRGMQYGHAVYLDAVNDAAVISAPQIVHCCECEYNNHCLTQEFVEEASMIPFDKNTWFCADAKAAPTVIESEGE